MKRLRILGLIALLTACASNSEAPFDPRADNAQADLERGIKRLDENRPAEAIRIFERILTKTPATEFDFVVLYNLGAAQEGMKKCAEAAESYRSVARGVTSKFARLEAMALLRLGYAYECQGQDDKALIALLDTRKRVKALPDDTAKTELPARIAAAYARTGNRTEAEKYFKEALNGIKVLQVKYKDSRQMGDTLAQALYFMGLSHITESDFLKNPVSQIKGLELMQLYLLQAAELSSPKWSGRAVEEILSHYERVWQYSSKLQIPQVTNDQAIDQRSERELKSEVFKEALRSVRVLRNQRIPSRTETKDVERLFNSLEAEEKKLTTALSELGTDTPLTPQAEKRQGLKSQGRVSSRAESPLEVEAKKRATLPPKKK